jgi:ubiquitin-conjugating enzyme E2 J1
METDARGQLGGVEMNGKEREKLARGSGGWRCGVCGRSNGEILKECEDAVKAKEEEEGAGKVKEVEVPSELKMGFKDEMSKGKERNEEAELAEGFVKTADGAGDAEPVVTETTQPAATNAQSPAERIPTIEQSVHNTAFRPAQQLAPRPAQRRSAEGVPIWIDRAIAGVVVLLVAMVMKMLLGL